MRPAGLVPVRVVVPEELGPWEAWVCSQGSYQQLLGSLHTRQHNIHNLVRVSMGR